MHLPLLYFQIHTLEDICHPSYTVPIKFVYSFLVLLFVVVFLQMVISFLTDREAYLVHLSFQDGFPSKTSKIILKVN